MQMLHKFIISSILILLMSVGTAKAIPLDSSEIEVDMSTISASDGGNASSPQPAPVNMAAVTEPTETEIAVPQPTPAPIAPAKVNIVQPAVTTPYNTASPELSATVPSTPNVTSIAQPSAPAMPVAGPPGAPGTPGPAAPFKQSGYVEAGGDFSAVTHDYGNWYGEYVKGEIQTDPNNRWNAELLNLTAFRQTGVYGAIGNTHDFNEDWFSNINIGGSEGGLYLPRYRVDAFLNRKWLEDRQLITTIGFGDYKAMDVHNDQSIFFGATYYFPELWVVQGGIRFNNSHPGGVNSNSQFVAVTEGEQKKHLVTLRYGWGEEAYQIIGPGQALSDFNSQTISLEWRQWLNDDWGFDARGEQYHNPNYDRTGINLGIFKDF